MDDDNRRTRPDSQQDQSNRGDRQLVPSVLQVSYYSDRPDDSGMAEHYATVADLPLSWRDLLFEGGNLISDGQGTCIMSDRVLYVSYRYNIMQGL